MAPCICWKQICLVGCPSRTGHQPASWGTIPASQVGTEQQEHIHLPSGQLTDCHRCPVLLQPGIAGFIIMQLTLLEAYPCILTESTLTKRKGKISFVLGLQKVLALSFQWCSSKVQPLLQTNHICQHQTTRKRIADIFNSIQFFSIYMYIYIFVLPFLHSPPPNQHAPALMGLNYIPADEKAVD